MLDNNKEISDFITFPRTFEKYKWYRPIIVFIVGFIIMLIFEAILMFFLKGRTDGTI